MINNFKETFGTPDQTIVTFGDFEQKKHMKYKEVSRGKGLRTLFRKNGYKVYLVDEFRTSCKCSECNGGECKNTEIRKNPRPNKNNLILSHCLIHCQNVNCGVWWNRDYNGAKNIYKIAHNAINNLARPNYLCREINQKNQNLHGMQKPNIVNFFGIRSILNFQGCKYMGYMYLSILLCNHMQNILDTFTIKENPIEFHKTGEKFYNIVESYNNPDKILGTFEFIPIAVDGGYIIILLLK